MSCSLLLFIVVGVSLSLFPHTSNGDFFHDYGLVQPEHLDQSAMEKLERRYRNCVAKFKSLNRSINDDLIPSNLDISIQPDFWQIWNTFWNVKLWPNNKIPIELDVSVQTFEERLACAVLYFHTKTCIRFVKKQEHHKNFLFISNNGCRFPTEIYRLLCSSDEEVIMEKDEQTVNFGGKNDSNCWKHERIVYELMQAVGNNALTDDMDSFKLNQLYQCNSSKATNKAIINQSIKILIIGGVFSEPSMEYYYPHQSQYNSLINVTMIKPRSSHASVVMNDGKIMTMGGFRGDYYFNDVEIFDPITNTLIKGPNMNMVRDDCGSAIINGIVYVCGGYDGENRLSSCERYQSGVWEYIAPMNKVRRRLRLISLNGYLYAIGGYDENFINLNSVEKYNPNSNSWVMVKSMQTPHEGAGAAVLNGFIYVCDGFGVHSCERYGPKLNKWSNITKTIKRGQGLRMVSDGHHLFAFGGFYSNARLSVEMYDPKKDKWILFKKPMIHKRWYSSAVVLH